MPPTRVPCDQCRHRRVRCDGTTPCLHCQRSGLSCRRDYVRKRRGPKYGSGMKIAALKAAESLERALAGTTLQSASTIANITDRRQLPQQEARPPVDACSGNDFSEPVSALMKRCVRVYLHHMYPIMPIIRPAELHAMLDRPREANETSMLLALCALVTTFMCGRSESILGDDQWRPVAQYFLGESIALRSCYGHIEDDSVFTLLASFFVSTAYFELHNVRLCWFYLREAITLAQALGLHTEEFYLQFDSVEALYHRRIYNILFITERSFAVSQHKPVLLTQPLPLPIGAPEDEPSEIDVGFRQLIQTYSQLNVGFINFWSRFGSALSTSSSFLRLLDALRLEPVPHGTDGVSDTQKVDILVTRHWLQLVYWKSALHHSLLSSAAQTRSMTFAYPEDIALSLLRVLASVSTESIEVHGLGIFEKIFDIGCALADIIHCSIKLTGQCVVSQKMDRLDAILQHLYLTPNSRAKYAQALQPRVSSCFLLCTNNIPIGLTCHSPGTRVLEELEEGGPA